MEAFGRYLMNHPKYLGRVFVSSPPGAALLIWSNRDFLPNITGISLVEQVDGVNSSGIEGKALCAILKKQLYNTIPVLDIAYDGALDYMIVDGARMSLAESAGWISDKFSLKLGSHPAKKPNDLSQINDPFHLWSREAFDGRSVYKTDIDLLTLTPPSPGRAQKVKTIIEVKRSAKNPVGKWKPYVDLARYNDANNYLITMTLCNLLKANFYTIHHDAMDDAYDFTGNERIDMFSYKPGPDQATLRTFAHEDNRRVVSIDGLFN